jgi:hypothetical protein
MGRDQGRLGSKGEFGIGGLDVYILLARYLAKGHIGVYLIIRQSPNIILL